MNQIIKMFEESNARMNSILQGNANLDKISAAQREFEGQIKLLNCVISAFAIQSKNKRAAKDLENMNIMDSSTAIDLLGDVEVEKIKCRATGRIITRGECLDNGGRLRDCEGCENGTETKNKLVPIKQ